MAGSYNYVVDKNGGLNKLQDIVDILNTPGYVFEAIEEIYGMIWYLAHELERGAFYENSKDAIEEARTFYKEGLIASPTKRYK